MADCEPYDRGQVLGSNLLIPRVGVADQGNYSCVADFRRFNRRWRVSRTRRVRVFIVPPNEKPPTVLLPLKNTTVEAEIGQRLQLLCLAFFGYDVSRVPLLYWLVDGYFVEDVYNASDVWEHQARVVNESYGERYVQRLLEFRSVTELHLGPEFTCVAQNAFGFTNASILIVRKEPPPSHTAAVAGSLLGSLALLLLLAGLLYARRIDLLLFYRDHHHHLHPSSSNAADGKEYDAYVSFCTECPSPGEEEFALKLLPQVLEGELGYRLCLLDRDILPGGGLLGKL
ncbi:X-linked interleukin-1 receptor accessory protein-like 2 [Lethenteron reissneri]|uniref:X-linked interleukin-1 receptor accessory protein-like 2 n=1 Tax=Lethenteron reissneri TaxID=7753 RepID=UPI002AB6E548|nr:X-linked interleukin-1 receptor accessory protein-like 2 [Lethenteron reissneri]